MTISADIAVVGGGLAGLSAAVAAARGGAFVLHVAPASPPDLRTSALMRPSVSFLERAGLIEAEAGFGVPLRRIRLIDATGRLLRAPETLFEAQEVGVDAFGWNFPNRALAARFEAAAEALPTLSRRRTLLQSARRAESLWHLELADGAKATVPLLVGADGRGSRVRDFAGIAARERPLPHSALVCDLELERPLEGTSVEFHYPEGPFTLVPAGGRQANLVWVDRAGAFGPPDTDWPELFAEKSMRLFGKVRVLTPVHIFPLVLLEAASAGRAGAVLVGEAAHAFPPIGAQGLNLGLRDVETLASRLALADRRAPGWAESLSEDYARHRRGDLSRTAAFVETLYGSLVSELLPAQALRAAGLWALKSLPPLRRRAFALGMGGTV